METKIQKEGIEKVYKKNQKDDGQYKMKLD